jgi:flagellar motor switch protein FliG
MTAKELKGVQKASILIMSLGASASSEVFRFLNDQEIEVLTSEIMRTQGVDGTTRDAVLHEFEQRCASGALTASPAPDAGSGVGSILELVAED